MVFSLCCLVVRLFRCVYLALRFGLFVVVVCWFVFTLCSVLLYMWLVAFCFVADRIVDLMLCLLVVSVFVGVLYVISYVVIGLIVAVLFWCLYVWCLFRCLVVRLSFGFNWWFWLLRVWLISVYINSVVCLRGFLLYDTLLTFSLFIYSYCCLLWLLIALLLDTVCRLLLTIVLLGCVGWCLLWFGSDYVVGCRLVWILG